MTTKLEHLLQILVETSFHEKEAPIYRLSSGMMSPSYIDCKMALSYPEARLLIGELIMERVHRLPIQAVGGLELGAYPIATAVSDAAYRHYGMSLMAFVVRKQSKPHGLQKFLEGDVKSGMTVLMVDDVVTTGKSTIEAITKSRDAGLNVINTIAIVDRQEENGQANIEAQGVSFEALVTLPQLRNFTMAGATR